MREGEGRDEERGKHTRRGTGERFGSELAGSDGVRGWERENHH